MTSPVTPSPDFAYLVNVSNNASILASTMPPAVVAGFLKHALAVCPHTDADHSVAPFVHYPPVMHSTLVQPMYPWKHTLEDMQDSSNVSCIHTQDALRHINIYAPHNLPRVFLPPCTPFGKLSHTIKKKESDDRTVKKKTVLEPSLALYQARARGHKKTVLEPSPALYQARARGRTKTVPEGQSYAKIHQNFGSLELVGINTPERGFETGVYAFLEKTCQIKQGKCKWHEVKKKKEDPHSIFHDECKEIMKGR